MILSKVLFFTFVYSSIHTTKALPAQTPTASCSNAPASSPSSQSGLDQEHIVLLASNGGNPNSVLEQLGLSVSHPAVKYAFNNSVFQGFVANLPEDHASALNAMSEVSSLEQSVTIKSHQETTSKPSDGKSPAWTRPNSPWGLQRVSSSSTVRGNPAKMAYTYSFSPNSPLGAGVDIYVVDSGINTEHQSFGNRAHMGFSFDPHSAADGDGHGTHTAGVTASNPFGIATSANIVGVKVLGSDGSGSSSAILAGLDYVISQHDTKKSQDGFIGSVINMSLGLGSSSLAVNNAVLGASTAGIHIVVAAGNEATDACNSSPGQLGGAHSPVVTVGSIGQENSVSSFSNTGACVDIFAPGENVVSAWKDGPKVINSLSGTSMATPHVAGVIAVLMSQNHALGQNPASMKATLLSSALSGQVDGGGLLLNDGVTDATGLLGIMGKASKREEAESKWSMSDDPSDVRWKRNGETPGEWTMSDDPSITRW